MSKDINEVEDSQIDDLDVDVELDVDDDVDLDQELDQVDQDDYDSEDSDSEGENYEYEEKEEEYTEAETIELIVADEDRITSDVLSKYEIIDLINIRATQISKGVRALTDVTGLRDPISMAKKEIFDNQCPLLVKRHIGNNKFEIWNPNEMSKPKI